MDSLNVSLAYQNINKTFPLILDPVPLREGGGKWWYLEKPFEMVLLINGVLTTITVPQGFKTDFASIPRFAWSIVGHPCGEYKDSAVVHDFLYGDKRYPRTVNDQIFNLGNTVLKIAQWKRFILYRAVNIGGWYGYKNNINRFVTVT